MSNSMRGEERLPEVEDNAMACTSRAMVLYRPAYNFNPSAEPESNAGGSCPAISNPREERLEKRQKRRDSVLSAPGKRSTRRSVIQPRMLLDEYEYTYRGTPGVPVPLSVRADIWCQERWPLPEGRCGSIELLLEHRKMHQAKMISQWWLAAWEHKARSILIQHAGSITQKERNTAVLVENMRARGATPGEWRLIRLYRFANGKYGGNVLREYRFGVRGAIAEFPGVGRKSPKRLRQHLHERMVDLCRKYEAVPPSKPGAPSKRHGASSDDLRVQALRRANIAADASKRRWWMRSDTRTLNQSKA